MREEHRIQRVLTEPWLDLPYAKELEAIDRLLIEEPTIGRLAAQDLTTKRRDRGRRGMTGDEVIRALVLKQMNPCSYVVLHFLLHDSQTARAFMGYGLGDQPPSRSTLAANIKRISPETWQEINRVVLKVAEDHGVEKGRKVRIDTTAVDCNIHPPIESEQLWDVVRVLLRLMGQAKTLVGNDLVIVFADRSLRAKRRSLGAWNAKTKAQRRQQYRDLLKVTQEVMDSARRVSKQLSGWSPTDLMDAARAAALQGEIDRIMPLAERLCDTTTRRVINGESVPSTEKVLSIFEEHTDVIVKDNRHTHYGHKVCLTGGQSSMILDCQVLEGNPADSTLVEQAIETQRETYGRPPRQIALDGGFASRGNLAKAKSLGVKDVMFSKRRGLEVSDMAKSTWVYRRLRDFRAGIEGCISFLKRGFGLDRCTWRSYRSFRAYVHASVVSFNLLILARHLMP
jgi:transposase, IS5 family